MKGAIRRILAAVAALAVAAVGPAWGQKLERVRFGTNWVAQAEHGGFYQSVADGTYARHGLDVTIVQGGPQVNCNRRSPKECGIWRRRTIAMSSAADLCSCGAQCCAGRRARSRSSRPGWRILNSTEIDMSR